MGNKDDNMEKVKAPAEKLWAAVKNNHWNSEEFALLFLRTAFTEQAARTETASILVDQVKTLQNGGVEAALSSLGATAIPLCTANLAAIKAASPDVDIPKYDRS